MLWGLLQFAIVGGTIWFFTAVTPSEGSLGSKVIFGIAIAALATGLLTKGGEWLSRGYKRLDQIAHRRSRSGVRRLD
jgi:hypothetical protein